MFHATHAHVQSGAAQRAAVPSEPPGGGGGAAGSAEGEPELTVTAACLASSHLELVEVAPPLRTLAALLAAAPFGEAAAERVPGAPAWGYTWEELWARVQCSRAQLQAGLRAQRAACLRGRWCLLQPAYQTTLLDVLLLTAGAQGWPLSAFDSNAMVAAVAADGFDAEAARHVLSLYAGPSHAGPGPAGDGLWGVDAPALCRARAQTLLAAAERRRCDEFMAAWRASLPEGVVPSLELLRGEALVEQSGAPPPRARAAALTRRRTGDLGLRLPALAAAAHSAGAVRGAVRAQAALDARGDHALPGGGGGGGRDGGWAAAGLVPPQPAAQGGPRDVLHALLVSLPRNARSYRCRAGRHDFAVALPCRRLTRARVMP